MEEAASVAVDLAESFNLIGRHKLVRSLQELARDEIFKVIAKEKQRQEDEVCLIASENYVSKDILKAQGSILTNKYAEGYSGKRYYGGCSNIDTIEEYAIQWAKDLFNAEYANVQPHSGSQANQAVYLALCKPGETILGMGLDAGGHLTHGCRASSSGKLYKSISYGLKEDDTINYEEIAEKLRTYRPRVLVVGASAYPRAIDFKRFRKMVDDHNKWQDEEDAKNLKLYNEGKIADLTPESYPQCVYCYLMVDMAHIAGLVATGLHQSPLPYADVVTSTTHKTLRGPRGGLILSNNRDLFEQLNKAVFPGIQGGPLEHVIAAKALCFNEASSRAFRAYAEQILKNIQAMQKVFNEEEVPMVSGGSDNHLLLLDLRKYNITGLQLEQALEKVGIIVNKNAVYNDPRPKTETSGIRIGTAAVTTRGFNEDDCAILAKIISCTIKMLAAPLTFSFRDFKIDDHTFSYPEGVKGFVNLLCKSNPIYK